jgi:DNA repair protein RecN (Recombination protein N)
MLRELRIKNFAVIDEAALELGDGLNVLTGETGAGKTIVLNALGLICGGRVSSDIIRHGEDEASVEALFSALPQPLRDRLRETEFGGEEELVIKRIVSRSGRNRIYINSSLCPLALLSEVGGHLVHIYGQHEHQALLRPDTHLALLDSYGGLEARAAEMREKYRALSLAWSAVRQARELLERRRREEEALRFQANEITQARLQEGEEEALQARKNILIHSERLFQGCKEGEELLYEGEDALVSRLGRYVLRLRELAHIDPGLDEAVELLESSQAHLQEATAVLRRYSGKIQFEPGALEALEDRLAEIRRLKRKYSGTVESILKLKEIIAEELKELDRGEEEMPALVSALEAARSSAWRTAEALSGERKKVSQKFSREMEKELAGLGMAGTKFAVRFVPGAPEDGDAPFLADDKKLGEQGIDQVEYYFSPNPGEEVKPLAKIASGGELSRLMLAIKSLVLTRGDISTLLFDEVDAGIGGRVAEIVGKRLKKVASSHQVLCVTHLPQIAALADSHYVVHKEVIKGRTFATVRRLNERERIAEVARMLGGVNVTDKTRRHAEEMVKRQG